MSSKDEDTGQRVAQTQTYLDWFRPEVSALQLKILGLLYIRPNCSISEIQASIACGDMVEFNFSEPVGKHIIELLDAGKVVRSEDDRFSLSYNTCVL